MDIYDSLEHIHGEDVARGEFMQALDELALAGLSIDDDMLYDDPTPRP